jgi:hypothetical protein
MAFCMEVQWKMMSRLPRDKNAAATATATIMTWPPGTACQKSHLVAASGYRKLSILAGSGVYFNLITLV